MICKEGTKLSDMPQPNSKVLYRCLCGMVRRNESKVLKRGDQVSFWRTAELPLIHRLIGILTKRLSSLGAGSGKEP